jgi:hypothetical protein
MTLSIFFSKVKAIIFPKRGPLSQYIHILLKEGQSHQQIESHLILKGHDRRYVKEYIQQAANLRTNKRKAKHLTIIYAGVRIILVLLLVSFLVTRYNNKNAQTAQSGPVEASIGIGK